MKLSDLHEGKRANAARFRAAVKKSGLSQTKIAKKVGLHKSEVSKHASGLRVPSMSVARKYNRIPGFNAAAIWDLLGEVESEEESDGKLESLGDASEESVS